MMRDTVEEEESKGLEWGWDSGGESVLERIEFVEDSQIFFC